MNKLKRFPFELSIYEYSLAIKIIFCFPFLAIVFSCSNKNQSDLAGVWEIEELKITMNSYQNTDTARVVEATRLNREEKMHVRNIQTHFNSDGTYHSVHKDLHDSIFYDPAGTWRIEGDSLIIQDTIPKRITYRFKIKASPSVVEYWGIEDFDQDGQADDEYYSRQRKMN
jgi:hypothetical protein